MNLTYYYTLNARETLIIYQSIISLQITRMILSKSFTPQTTAAKRKNYTTEYPTKKTHSTPPQITRGKIEREPSIQYLLIPFNF